jgi:hypothetical protein
MNEGGWGTAWGIIGALGLFALMARIFVDGMARKRDRSKDRPQDGERH